jgi:kynureninase
MFSHIFKKKSGAHGFQISCFDVFSYARLFASLSTIERFGGMEKIVEKNGELYNYVHGELSGIGNTAFKVISPPGSRNHGGHIAIRFPNSYKT